MTIALPLMTAAAIAAMVVIAIIVLYDSLCATYVVVAQPDDVEPSEAP